MNGKKRRRFSSTVAAAALAVLAGGGHTAVENRVGAAFLALPMSVRQMGMGEVSLGGTDVLRSWCNPALLADQTSLVETAINGSSMYSRELTTGGLGAGWRPLPWLAAGAFFSCFTVSVPEVDLFGKAMAKDMSQDFQTIGGTVAAKRGFLRTGITLKGMSETLEDEKTSAWAVDLGLVARWKGLVLGAAERNLGGTIRNGEVTSYGNEVLPTETDVAASYETALAGRLVAGAGYSIPRGRYGSAGLGADWWPVPLFGVRLGAVGLGGKDDIRLTGGISALWKGIGIDYALGTHPLGMNHRFSLSYAFGRPPVAAVADRPEPVPAASPTRETAVLVGTGINIAVAELSAQGMSASDAAVITDVLRNELVKTGRFKVIEKQNMDKVLAEQAFQQTGCTTDECAVRLGKLLNVQRIVVGSFGKLIDKYLVNLRVVNVETGEIIFGDSVGGRTVEEIEAGLKAIAARMAAQIR